MLTTCILGIIFIIVGICYFSFYIKFIYSEIEEEMKELKLNGIRKILAVVINCIQAFFTDYYSLALIVFTFGPIILGTILLILN